MRANSHELRGSDDIKEAERVLPDAVQELRKGLEDPGASRAQPRKLEEGLCLRGASAALRCAAQVLRRSPCPAVCTGAKRLVDCHPSAARQSHFGALNCNGAVRYSLGCRAVRCDL